MAKPVFVPFDDNDIKHVESPWAPYYDPDPFSFEYELMRSEHEVMKQPIKVQPCGKTHDQA